MSSSSETESVMAVTVADVEREVERFAEQVAEVYQQIPGNKDLFVALSFLAASGTAVARAATDENPKVVAVAMTLVQGAEKMLAGAVFSDA